MPKPTAGADCEALAAPPAAAADEASVDSDGGAEEAEEEDDDMAAMLEEIRREEVGADLASAPVIRRVLRYWLSFWIPHGAQSSARSHVHREAVSRLDSPK